MTKTVDIRVSRFRDLPQVEDVWQGAIVRMPGWVVGEDRPPYRPYLCVWLSRKTGFADFTGPIRPEDVDQEAMIDSMASFARNGKIAGYVPTGIEVQDPDLAERFRDLLKPLNVSVELVGELELVDGCMHAMKEKMLGPIQRTTPFDGEGVRLEDMRSFAEAATVFYRARPWLHLTGDDLIQVEGTVPDSDLACCTVMGRGRLTRGLAFFASIEEFHIYHDSEDDPDIDPEGYPCWGLTYGPLHELPLADADLWEEHDLPHADDTAYPLLIRASWPEEDPRPDRERLVYVEGLLRALAATTEDEMDSGRWEKRVRTVDGDTVVRLTLPFLLEAPETDAPVAGRLPDRRLIERTMVDLQAMLAEQEFASVDEMNAFIEQKVSGTVPPQRKASTDLERAQDIFYQALEAEGRRRIKLAREAIRTCRDFADPYVLLAEEMQDLAESARLYREGIAAGERQLGPEGFEEHAGDFWRVLETRPYMRARLGLAQCLYAMGEKEASVEHLGELLRLNPGDNQGVRYLFIPRLLELGWNDKAAEALSRHDREDTTMMHYLRALLLFRREGDSAAARRARGAAIRANSAVPKWLAAKEGLPLFPPEAFEPGSEHEAVICAAEQMVAWRETPGAIEWLRRHRRDRKQEAKKQATKAKHGKGKGGPGKRRR